MCEFINIFSINLYLMGSYKDLIVYQKAYKLAMDIFERTQKIPLRRKV
jgi:hypothetical protein